MGRNLIVSVLLWICVFAWSAWVGGTLYQMLVVVPVWSAAPPGSIRDFLRATDYNRLVLRFFGPPYIAVRVLPVLLALAAAWPLPRQRAALLIATGCILVIVAITLGYIYPINSVLFFGDTSGRSPEEIRQMAARWVRADRIRFLIGLAAFAAILWAFRLPTTAP